MLSNTSPDLPQNKNLQIKQENKFYSRLLSKENSVASPSQRVYYGGVSCAVPFTWESQPGTPKYTFSDTSSLLPPLTPPPSYNPNNSKSKPMIRNNRNSRSGLLQALFPKIISLKKANVVPNSSSSSSSSSLSSLSWSSSPLFVAMSPRKYQRSRFYTPAGGGGGGGSSFDSRADDEEGAAAAIGSPTSTLCLAINGSAKLRGCYGW